MRQLIAALFVLATLLSTAGLARATETSYWIPADGLWADAANWTLPPTSRNLVIDNGGTANIPTNLPSVSVCGVDVIIGDAGVGHVVDTAGTFGPAGYNPSIHTITLGNLAGANGSFSLAGVSNDSGRALTSMEIGKILVGNRGKGSFTQSDGGAFRVMNSFYLGKELGGVGTYNLSGGVLYTIDYSTQTGEVKNPQVGNATLPNFYVGYNGTGTFNQSGGENSLNMMYLGYGEYSWGTYNLSGGTLFAPVTVNYGEFKQSGGSSRSCTVLPEGKYTMTGGTFAGPLTVQGTVVQDGGTVNTRNNGDVWDTKKPGLNVSGRYELKSGSLVPAVTMQIMPSSGKTAEFIQTGGTVRFADMGSPSGEYGILSIGDAIAPFPYYSSSAVAKYTLAGGSLRADIVYLGYTSSSTGSKGELAITDASAQLVVTTQLRVMPTGRFKAVPGSTIRFEHATWQPSTPMPCIQLYTSTAAAVADLINVSLDFEDAQAAKYMNVYGHNLGPVEAGYVLNFAVGSIVVGAEMPTTLILQSSYSSAPFHAQYVEDVVIGEGSTLNLNGRSLYYKTFTNLGGTLLFNGGRFIQVRDASWHIGDANIDGQVTDADYTLWVDNYGKVGAAWAEGDFSGDGQTTDADYTLWADNYGFGMTGNVVPEPATLSLLGAGVLALIRRRA